jgi:hypothetical protein
VQLIKVKEAYRVYKNLIVFYAIEQLINYTEEHKIESLDSLLQSLPEKPVRLQWTNVGGQLLPVNSLQTLFSQIKDGSLNDWDQVHEFYQDNGKAYKEQKLQHAFASLLDLLQIPPSALTKEKFKNLILQATDTKEWMVKNIFESRAKDYQNQFRKMVYDNEKEMEVVVGKLDDNLFIAQQKDEFQQFKSSANHLIKQFNL